MPDSRTRRGYHLFAAGLIVAAVWVVYRPIVPAYFYDDDFQWLVSSMSFEPAKLIDFASITHFYRPVIDIYFAAAAPLFDGSPRLFHVANIVLHAVNGLLVFGLARDLAASFRFGCLAALFFVVQPGDIDAVAWVGALAEPVAACLGLLSILGLLWFRETRWWAWRLLSIATFLLALLTHESSVVFLPLLALTAWIFTRNRIPVLTGLVSTPVVVLLAPYVLLTAAYLSLDLWINSRNYVVSGGFYAVGWHVVRNALDYIVTLYVGRPDLANYSLVALGAPALLFFGSLRVRYATAWMLLALAPFLFFTWGNTSRYLYLPAIGFSMLLAEGLLWFDRALGARLSRDVRALLLGVVAAALVGRFMVFARENVRSFAARTEVYRQYGEQFRQFHGPLAPYSTVQADARLRIDHEPEFVVAMIQWLYKDPTLDIVLPPRQGRERRR